jgi:signal transduction histidine kinase
MTRRLLLSYLTITAFVLLILEVPLAITFERSERNRLESAVEHDADSLASFSEDRLEGHPSSDVQRYAVRYQQRTGGRVVIVDKRGVSVADSAGTPGADFSRDRPEIAIALRGQVASGTRYSHTLGQHLLYVAVPVASDGKVYGAVRITYPTTTIDRRVRRNWLSLLALAGVVLATVGVVGYVLARSVTRPVRGLGEAADALARGNLDARAPTGDGPPEVRALASEFNDMADRLEELVNAQRTFVADASHELRTPLTALRLRMENLAATPTDELRRDDLEAATDEVARLARLVDGLLALARAEGKRPEREVVDVAGEVHERVDVWRALAEEQEVDLALSTRGDTRALAVPGAVAQILDNLLANALEVSPPGTEVHVHADAIDGRVEVHVIDHGPGLPPEDRRRAFDRFWRAESGPDGGSGLGLAIVSQLAHASGGRAQLLEAKGGGIDALVTLPRANGVRE